MIILHGLLQCLRGIHAILQSRDPTGSFEPINPQAQLRPHQPVQRGKRLFVDDRRHANDQRLPERIRHGDCTQTPRLSSEQGSDAGALISGNRRVVGIRLHGQMVTLAPIDLGIEWG